MKSTLLTPTGYIFGIYASLAYGAVCGQSEYMSAANECCPMCTIGLVILKDCYGDYSTTCKPCSKGTFMNEPNGLHQCFQCKTCDSGLYILHDCTTITNTVCEISDGYYCMNDLNKARECSLAMKHSQCKPGEQIKTPGTRASDTVCEPCPPGFYSPDGVNCSKSTDTVENDIDVQHSLRTWNMRYGLFFFFLFFLLVLIFFYLIRQSTFKTCITLKRPVEETTPCSSKFAPSSSELVPEFRSTSGECPVTPRA